MSPILNRREALELLGAAVVSACGSSLAAMTESAPTACVLSPALDEGPFFVDEKLNRSDLTTGTTNTFVTHGVPLTLAVTVVKFSSGGCAALPGAQVDIWQAHAGGKYGDESSEGTLGDPYLRGFQMTDRTGRSNFKTIYPGWYRGRAVHIHAQIRVFSTSGVQTVKYDTQMFFDPAITASVVARSPYSTRGNPDTVNSTDRIYARGGSRTMISLTPSGPGYAGTITLGVQA